MVTPDLYTHGHHESVLRSHRWRTAENSAAYLPPHVHRGMSLLDVGCGPGTITFDLARRWHRDEWSGSIYVARSWRGWAAEPDGVFVVVHGEVVARA